MKSWIVKQKQIKKSYEGLARHSNYLIDEKRPSHKGTEITVLCGSSEDIASAHDLRAKDRQEQGLRGGGIRNKATSFVLSLPPEIRPDHKQWKRILGSVYIELGKALGVDKKELFKHSFAVLHEREGGAPHVHLLCSNVVNGEYHKDLTKYAGLNAVKRGLNLGVKAQLGIDWRKHKPENPNCGDMPLHVAREKKAKEAEQKAIEASKQANIDTLKANQANEELNLTKADLKTLKRFNTNYGKELKIWFESQDEKSALKSESKLQKMHNKIKKRFSDRVLNELGHYGATAEAENKKNRKTGVKRRGGLSPN